MYLSFEKVGVRGGILDVFPQKRKKVHLSFFLDFVLLVQVGRPK